MLVVAAQLCKLTITVRFKQVNPVACKALEVRARRRQRHSESPLASVSPSGNAA